MKKLDIDELVDRRYANRKAILDQFPPKEVEAKTPLTEEQAKEIANQVNNDLIERQKGTQARIKEQLNKQGKRG